MSVYTRFLHLLKRTQANESLAEDGYAVFNGNLDRLDAAAELVCTHRHNGQSVTEPGSFDPPDLAITSDADGAFPGEITVLYRIAKVVGGVESTASDIADIDTPVALSTPPSPAATPVATGGNLPGGIYGYAITAWRGIYTFETKGSTPSAMVNVPMTTATWRVSLDLPAIAASIDADADGINIYRRVPNSTTWNFLASVPRSDFGDAFIDDDVNASSAERLLPSIGYSQHSSSITITPPEALGVGESWRLYRTIDQDDDTSWANSFLVELDDSAPWEDLGSPAMGGEPRTSDFELLNPSPIDLGAEIPEITGILPPANGGAGFMPVVLIAVSAVDGTATQVIPLNRTPHAPPNGIIPAGFVGGSPIAIGVLETALGSGYYPDGMTVVVLGPNAGVYLLDANDDLSAAWPPALTNLPALVTSGSWRGVLDSTGDAYVTLATPTEAPLPAATWTGPVAHGGGTIEIAEGDVVFVPLPFDATQVVDALRVGIDTAGDPDAKLMLYLAAPSTTNVLVPRQIMAAVEVDADVALDELVGEFDLPADVSPDRWWLGIHNHTTGIAAATLHGYAAAEHLTPLPAVPPPGATGNTGLIAAAGLTELTTAAGLTFAPVSQAPIIQARTA